MQRVETRDSVRRAKFAKKAESLASLARIAIYLHAKNRLSGIYSDDAASSLAMSISSYVFGFGLADDALAHENLGRSLDDVLRTMSGEFKTDCTGTLMLLAAARQIDVADFSRHMTGLADRDFAQVGRKTPNVLPALPREDRQYQHELTAMAPRRPPLPSALPLSRRPSRRRFAVMWGG
jgi:hypothetical protein